MGQQLACEGLIARCQGVAGIAVLVARQRSRRVILHAAYLQLVFDCGAHAVIAATALVRQHVLVEWADEDEDPVAAPLEPIDGPQEESPLERTGGLHPGKVLPGHPSLVPGQRLVPKAVVGWRQTALQGLE